MRVQSQEKEPNGRCGRRRLLESRLGHAERLYLVIECKGWTPAQSYLYECGRGRVS